MPTSIIRVEGGRGHLARDEKHEALPLLDRHCLLNKSTYGLLRLLSVVWRGYHAVKLRNRELVGCCLASGLIPPIFKEMWFHL